MTKKARFIEKQDALSADEKREITDFFTKHPNYENHIDWNRTGLVYQDFEQAFSLAKNSSRSIKRKVKSDPRLLFEKYNCEIISRTGDFLIAVPLDWECAVFFNSFSCGGEKAHWCIGSSDDALYWNGYLSDKNVFFLIFFVNKHPVFKRKVVIQYHVDDGKYTLWLQNDTRAKKISSPLDTALELIKNTADQFLHRICPKDYILDGSTLIRCYDCETIDIPAGVTAIRYGAFAFCENLVTITLPAGITAIEDVAFACCKNLVSVDIPAGVTAIRYGAFAFCENLATITLPAGITAIEDFAFMGCKNLKAIDIPAGVTIIRDGAFTLCKSLAAINIPDSVTSIGDFAFSGCKNLTGITVGKQNQRFSDLDGVLFDKIRNRILHYPAGNPNTCYTIPDGITAIESSAFSGCKYLKMVYLSRKTSIANYAFAETPVKFFYKD